MGIRKLERGEVYKRRKGPLDTTKCAREKKDVGEMWRLKGGNKGDRVTLKYPELPPEGSSYKATSLSRPFVSATQGYVHICF